jgi:hypothetical protein
MITRVCSSQGTVLLGFTSTTCGCAHVYITEDTYPLTLFSDLPIRSILGCLLELRGTFSEAESSERSEHFDRNSTKHRKVEKRLELGWHGRIETDASSPVSPFTPC